MATAFVVLWPFHIVAVGLVALLCQDAFTKKRVTVRSLFALTTVVGLELGLLRWVGTLLSE